MADSVQPAKSASAIPLFHVSSSPHLATPATTQRIMFEVCLAMLPLFIVGVIMFRHLAVIITVVTVAGCLAAEAIGNWMRGRSQASLADGSAVVTGIILAFSLPPTLNPYQAFIGGMVAIGLAKAVFGGIGQNLFNPAMVGRAFLMICYPAAMGVWAEPMTLDIVGSAEVDGVTMATPLQAIMDPNVPQPGLWALFLGNVPGCIGETSALAALIGGLWLVLRGVADWRQPLGVLASVALIVGIGHAVAPGVFEAGALYHLAAGSLMFGAFFIATDYVGAPVTPWGRIIFGVGVGVLVVVIRVFGAYPEGLMFAILLMNAATPMIERWTRPTPFGGHVPQT